MKVVSYLKTVPAKNTNVQKTKLLELFVKGVQANGDTGVLYSGNKMVSADVAVIQGWVYQNIQSPHLNLRHGIIKHQQNNKKYTVAADANLFLYANKNNPYGYLRYSFNGVFPKTGIYCDDTIDSGRWTQISKDLSIDLEPEKRTGKHILIMLQRQGGWSMNGEDVESWACKTIKKIKQYSDRPIVVRPHPGDKNAKDYLSPEKTRITKFQNVTISPQGTPLEIDLKTAWAVVNNNSSSIVGPLIKGYPGFITDPENSQCNEVSHNDFSEIEKPRKFDRLKWLERISMFHWKFDELENGKCWAHMRNYCQ